MACPTLGSVVWARFGKTAWWPAVVVAEHMTRTGLQPRAGHSCVMWLSSLQVSQVKLCHVSPFYSKLRQLTRKMSRTMVDTVNIALQIEAERGGVDLEGIEDLLDWGLADGGYLELAETSPHRFLPKSDDPIPEFVKGCLPQPFQNVKPGYAGEMVVPSENTKPAYKATPENKRLAEKALPENTRPTENASSENTRPTENASSENTRPTEKASSENTRPVEKASSENTRPEEKALSENTRPVEKALSENTRPVEKALSENTRPVEKALSENTRPVEKALSENTRPVEKALSENTRPVEKALSENTRPTEKASSDNTRLTEKASSESTEKILPQNFRPSKKVSPVNARSTKVSSGNTRLTETCPPLGSVVWARFGKTAWCPAVVVAEHMTRTGLQPRAGHSCVLWLSSLQVSQVKSCHTSLFYSKLRQHTRKMSHTMTEAVNKALRIEAERGRIHLAGVDNFLDWGLDDNGYLELAETSPHRFLPNPDAPIPEFVRESLQQDLVQHKVLPKPVEKPTVKNARQSGAKEEDLVLTELTKTSDRDASQTAANEKGETENMNVDNVEDIEVEQSRHVALTARNTTLTAANEKGKVSLDLLQHTVSSELVVKPTARNSTTPSDRDARENAAKEQSTEEDMNLDNVEGIEEEQSKNDNPTVRITRQTPANEKGIVSPGLVKATARNASQTSVKENGQALPELAIPTARIVRQTTSKKEGNVLPGHDEATGNVSQTAENNKENAAKLKTQEDMDVDSVEDTEEQQNTHVKQTAMNASQMSAKEKGQEKDMEKDNIENKEAQQNKHVKPATRDANLTVVNEKSNVLSDHVQRSARNARQTARNARQTVRDAIETAANEKTLEENMEVHNVEDEDDLLNKGGEAEDLEGTSNSCFEHPREDQCICTASEAGPPLGSVVWARFGKTAYWPAVVIAENMTHTGLQPRPGHSCVLWLSSLEVSQVKSCDVSLFYIQLWQRARKMSRTMTEVVRKALKIEAERGSVNLEGVEDLLDWGLADGGYLELAETSPCKFLPNPDMPIPEFVRECLQQMHHKVSPSHTTPTDRNARPFSAKEKDQQENVNVDNIKDKEKQQNKNVKPTSKNARQTAARTESNVSLGHIKQTARNSTPNTANTTQTVRNVSQIAEKMKDQVSPAHVKPTDRDIIATTAIAKGQQEDMEVDHVGDQEKQQNEDGDVEDLELPSSSCIGLSRQDSAESSLSSIEASEGCPPLGSVVWARFGKTSFWPAVVLAEHMTRTELQPRAEHSCVMWLSSLDVSQVKSCHVSPFYIQLWQRARKMSRTMTEAVKRALKIEAERGGLDLEEIEDLLDWGLSDGGYLELAETSPCKFLPNPDAPIPEFIQECLQQLHLKIISGQVRRGRPTADEGDVEEGVEIPIDSCMACPSRDAAKHAHPFFEGNLCTPCKEHFETSLFATDTDGSGCVCLVCGEDGKLLVCDSCSSTYCTRCVIKYISRKQLTEIEEQETWVCFLCTDYDPVSHGHLKTRANTLVEMAKISDHHYFARPHGFPNFVDSGKRKIRVLSLYDGIGTGKVVLDQLGIEVDIYYSCEIDRRAMALASHSGGVQQLGSVLNLTIRKLKSICPIDLVLGGPPCDDLSLVNPDRKGFDGSGIHIVYFIKILLTVQRLCGETNHVFYLMENTGNMPREIKRVVCGLMGQRSPAIWDAQFFTGMRRRRFFWGNIPGLQSVPFHRLHLEAEKTVLADAIASGSSSRQPMVTETRTITSSINSLTINNSKKESVVTMGGEDSSLYSVEIERLFGFPRGYTDCGRVDINTRRKLLGKAWSVHVVRQILLPLRSYFLTRSD